MVTFNEKLQTLNNYSRSLNVRLLDLLNEHNNDDQISKQQISEYLIYNYSIIGSHKDADIEKIIERAYKKII